MEIRRWAWREIELMRDEGNEKGREHGIQVDREEIMETGKP